MRPRGSPAIGAAATAASLLLAIGGIAAGRMTGWSIDVPAGISNAPILVALSGIEAA